MNRADVIAYVNEKFDVDAEYLWKRDPSACVFRCKGNRKWFGVVMKVKADRIGLEGAEYVDILDVRNDADFITFLLQSRGFFPGYHMNKKYWVTVILDEDTGTISQKAGTLLNTGIEELRQAVSDDQIMDLIDASFDSVNG